MNTRMSALILVVALLFAMTTTVFAATPAFHDIRPGYGVTKIGWLSDYHPDLRGTPGDTRVYTLDSGNPGGTVVILGGTHGSEIAGVMAATVMVEQAVPTQGRYIIIPHANNSNTDYQDFIYRNNVPHWFTVTTSEGVERTFRYGARRTNPDYESEPDPEVYIRGDEMHPGEESRNLNRVHPGKADGTLTEQISYGIVQVILQEEADVALDLHEAGETSTIANTIVAHDRAMDTAVLAVLDLSMQGLNFNLERSREEFRGLSHREWGDHTPALAILTETANPGQTRGVENPDILNDPVNPLKDRVGRQLAIVRAILDSAMELGLAEPITADNVPTHADMVENGLGAYLNSATAKP